MNIEDLNKLRDQAAAELTTSQANLAAIDEQIKTLRAQRRVAVANINRTRGALQFAEFASRPDVVEAPKPSPALERSQAALVPQPAATETVTPQ